MLAPAAATSDTQFLAISDVLGIDKGASVLLAVVVVVVQKACAVSVGGAHDTEFLHAYYCLNYGLCVEWHQHCIACCVCCPYK
jgi:hypothetical protein